jgi:mRNA-degrading endonuclease RelE of RelBE toxin-antitoxin system
MSTDLLIKKLSTLSPKKQDRILSFIRLVESEPDDDGIYDVLSPEVEDNLIRSLSFAPGTWDDE